MTNKQHQGSHLSDVALLDIGDVCNAVRMSKSWVRNEVVAQRFPPPMRIGPRCMRWCAASVRGWLIDRAVHAPVEAPVKHAPARAKRAAEATAGVCA